MKPTHLKLLTLVLLAALAQPVPAQESGDGRHSRMFAVPAPGKVVIDGDLKDWDRSAELEAYVMAATRAMQHGKMAVMYDNEALYLGGEVRKAIPVLNRHSPEGNGDRAWDADSIQFRLSVDPSLGYPILKMTSDKDSSDQIVHLLLWHYSDRQEACLHAKSSMRYNSLPGSEKFGVLPKKAYQGVYRIAEDSKGYTFEYRIPWSSLGAKTPPRGGDVVAATFQFNFGRRDGMMTADRSGWAYDLKGSPGFAYQNAGCWGKLIFSKTGRLSRDLVEEGLPPDKPMPCTFAYDLPEDGEVSVALYNASNEVVRVLMASSPRQAGRVVEKWDGLDELDHPLPAGRYTWKGLVHQPITTKYVLSVHNSGQPPHKTDDSTGGWGGDHGVPVAVCALGNDMLLAWDYNEGGWGLIRTDGEGKKRWGIINSQGFLATDGARVFGDTREYGSIGLRCFDAKDGRPLPFGNGASTLTPPPDAGGKSNTVTGLTYHAGKLFVAFGNRDLIGVYDALQGDLKETWSIPAPGSIAAGADGTLVAVSADRVVRIKDGKATPLIAEHLDQPRGVAVASDGTIHVSNHGALQNVSVFSPTGRYLKSIGKPGGRPRVGRFDPAGMLSPTALALDAKGRLWVTESIDYPKRVSVWDVQSGNLAKEFFGGAHYASFIWIDPERPDEVYCDGTIWKVDWEKQTSMPWSTCWRSRGPNSPEGFSTHTGGFRPFTAKNGRQYGLDLRLRRFYMREGDVFKPILAFGLDKKWPITATFTNQVVPHDSSLVWADQNDDQTVQAEEVIGPVKGLVGGASYVDAELNIWELGRVFRPLRTEKNGRPVYDFNAPETFANFRPFGQDPDDGSMYAFDNGYDWSGSLAPFDYGRFRTDGTVLWGYRGRVSWPKALNLPPQRLGKLWGPTQLLGTAGEFTGFATYYGCHHILTRREGLPVAMLFRDPRGSLASLGPNLIVAENYNGQLVQPKGMNRYFALGGDQDGRINEVLGLDTVKYLPGGEFTFSETEAKLAVDAQREYQVALARARKLIIVRGAKALPTAPVAGKALTADQSFKARLAYDAQNLYVRYEVASPSELVNAVTDPQLLFKGGNLLDIQLATDTSADLQRKTPAAGDLRLLITRRDGKPFAVMYRPKVKGFQGTPIVLTSPTGKESFDSIETCETVQLEYRPTKGAFTATATIPLATLGWTPQPGAQVRMDLGYIFGNNTGIKATGRAYWFNDGFAAGVLNDIPNESRLEPAEWGTATVE